MPRRLYPQLDLDVAVLADVREVVLAPSLAATLSADDVLDGHGRSIPVGAAVLSALKRARSVAWDTFGLVEAEIGRAMRAEGGAPRVDVAGVGRVEARPNNIRTGTDLDAIETVIAWRAQVDLKTGERRSTEDAVREAIRLTRATWGISEFRTDEGPGPTSVDGYRVKFVEAELGLDPATLSRREPHPWRPIEVDVAPMPVKARTR
jgi:hypothetical protein